jgi:hypothetical protein
MKIDEAIELQEKLFKNRMNIRRAKGHDYANQDNVHLNFDTLANICKMLNINVQTPEGCAMYMKILKLQRECNLLNSGKTPKNETILDTLLDEANYHDLELEILVRNGIVKLD